MVLPVNKKIYTTKSKNLRSDFTRSVKFINSWLFSSFLNITINLYIYLHFIFKLPADFHDVIYDHIWSKILQKLTKSPTRNTRTIFEHWRARATSNVELNTRVLHEYNTKESLTHSWFINGCTTRFSRSDHFFEHVQNHTIFLNK